MSVSFVIETESLSRHYGAVVALDALTVNIEAGISGLVGANGAGKSTSIRFLAPLPKAPHGESIVNGHSVPRDPMGVRRSVGYMPANFGVYDGMRGWELLDFFAVAYQNLRGKNK